LVLAVLYTIMLIVGLSMNKATANGIRGLPGFMSGTASYLEDPIISALNCSAEYPSLVATSALTMQSSASLTGCVGRGNSVAICDGERHADLVSHFFFVNPRGVSKPWCRRRRFLLLPHPEFSPI
jgi:hypothetical protein